MKATEKKTVGKRLLLLGCMWFTLALFWLPPMTLILGWLRLPDGFYKMLLPSEFVMSAMMAATGGLLWRSASGRVSFVAYVIVYSCATLAIVAVLNVYGWIFPATLTTTADSFLRVLGSAK
ncbi:MAG TPA: hypothetical protein VF753_00545, partial [Terriglobales bacterium]